MRSGWGKGDLPGEKKFSRMHDTHYEISGRISHTAGSAFFSCGSKVEPMDEKHRTQILVRCKDKFSKDENNRTMDVAGSGGISWCCSTDLWQDTQRNWERAFRNTYSNRPLLGHPSRDASGWTGEGRIFVQFPCWAYVSWATYESCTAETTLQCGYLNASLSIRE